MSQKRFQETSSLLGMDFQTLRGRSKMDCALLNGGLIVICNSWHCPNLLGCSRHHRDSHNIAKNLFFATCPGFNFFKGEPDFGAQFFLMHQFHQIGRPPEMPFRLHMPRYIAVGSIECSCIISPFLSKLALFGKVFSSAVSTSGSKHV